MQKQGNQTIKFDNPPQIISSASIVGNKENQGPLGEYFDEVISDGYNKQPTWEQAQIKMTKDVMDKTLYKASLSKSDLDYLLAGDLLDQAIASNFSARKFPVPFIGLYGACSTMIEAMALGAMMIDGGAANKVLTYTSSHYQATERQFRTPNEYGDKYPPYKQRTVTGAGATVLSDKQGGVQISEATFGKIVDLGVSDPQDMGSAMAPAASDTILQHLNDVGRSPSDYDLIVTGDLGKVGKSLVMELLSEKGCNVEQNFADCGVMLYNSSQKVGAGGSGCGSSAIVVSSYLLPQLMYRNLDRILVLGTGALLNSVTPLQGETIPCIAHAITLTATGHLVKGIGRKKAKDNLATKIETVKIENLSGNEG
ncbi:stage V sporulation protein AD [Halobacteroides halobius DSM 5150]|uniref:Stage V sporulation protein AD n=1 Tax=Halobacteroides halobius (strain ATCC 35273 / DSM 5150 / MD-1) TaxID=748449 RepID=L0K5K5_HALHC|nr:stage V sporulation protein AD [Halobacteroides halobius]AGB40567.1 stage V sporulation protein AD [Halobacteroides halobius DSM 5150]